MSNGTKRKGHLMKRIVPIITLAMLAAVAQATPVVTLSFTNAQGADGGIWNMYATVSNDCVGLASLDISFGGGAGPQIATSTVKAPYAFDTAAGRFVGFHNTPFRSNGTISGGAVIDILDSQDLAYRDSYDPMQLPSILVGVGQ